MPRQTPSASLTRQELPPLVLLDLALGLQPAHLLVDAVEQLLPGAGTGEAGALVLDAAEQALVQQPLRRAREGHAHALEGADQPRRVLAHGLDRRLIGQVAAALDGIDDVLLHAVVLALHVQHRVDAALGADRVRAHHLEQREQLHPMAGLGDGQRRPEPAEPAADDDDLAPAHAPPPNRRDQEADQPVHAKRRQQQPEPDAEPAEAPLRIAALVVSPQTMAAVDRPLARWKHRQQQPTR
jgi:hypothetical protein